MRRTNFVYDQVDSTKNTFGQLLKVNIRII